MKYYYVDTGEMRSTPKEGVQYTLWFSGSTQNNPGGREYVDVIKGEECVMRAKTEEALLKFKKSAFGRAPYIKPNIIVEKGDE